MIKGLLPPEQSKNVINSISGLGAGAISTVLLYPLDLIKTRYQVHEHSSKAYQSIGHAFRSIVQERGFFGLFRGMSPALYGSTLSWGLYMLLYNNAKARYASMADEGYIQNSWQYFFSALEAGMIVVPITNPIWLIKVRMQVQTTSQIKHTLAGKDTAAKIHGMRPYTSVTNAFRRIIAEEGVLTLYKGMVPAFFLTTHGAFKFLAYETLKKTYQTHVSPEMSVPPTLAIGAMAQVFASTTTYPYQVIKARLQQGGPNALHYTGTWDCIQKIIRNEGFLGLYKGIIPNILKVIPTGAIVFAAYETINSTLSSFLLV